jgi:hypothetical protein
LCGFCAFCAFSRLFRWSCGNQAGSGRIKPNQTKSNQIKPEQTRANQDHETEGNEENEVKVSPPDLKSTQGAFVALASFCAKIAQARCEVCGFHPFQARFATVGQAQSNLLLGAD